jgi:hypothetical protein
MGADIEGYEAGKETESENLFEIAACEAVAALDAAIEELESRKRNILAIINDGRILRERGLPAKRS